MSESCGTCRFSAPSVRPEKWDGLQCRRIPPVQGQRPAAEWPNIYGDGWCGDYEARPVAKAPARKKPAVGETEVRAEQG